jgi:hypothetical protein
MERLMQIPLTCLMPVGASLVSLGNSTIRENKSEKKSTL